MIVNEGLDESGGGEVEKLNTSWGKTFICPDTLPFSL